MSGDVKMEPCPHCGSDSCRVIGGPGTRGGPKYWAGCDHCSGRAWGDSQGEAIAAWNRRSSSAAERAVVEARREALEEAAKWIELVGRDWKADGQHEKRFAADYLAAGIRALSPPVG